jgi:hypothetical protein
MGVGTFEWMGFGLRQGPELIYDHIPCVVLLEPKAQRCVNTGTVVQFENQYIGNSQLNPDTSTISPNTLVDRDPRKRWTYDRFST